MKKAAPKKRAIKNSKAAPKASKKKPISESRKRELRNAFTESALGFNLFGIPGVNQGFSLPVNSVDTIFLNNRGYLISNMRQPLSSAYAEHGVIQTICDVPVNDAFRGGITIVTKQLEPEQIKQLQAVMKECDDLARVAQACKWNRLYGGGAVIPVTEQDPSTELNIEAIQPGSLLSFKSADLWELPPYGYVPDEYGPGGMSYDAAEFGFYDVRLNATRVKLMRGIEAPSFVRPRLRGWGLSVVECLVASVNQWFKSNSLIFEVLDEFKLDIFKIKNLATTLLEDGGQQIVQNRVQDMNLQKNFMNAMTMDTEDDYVQKQLTFSGLAEMKKEFRMDIACDVRFPITKLFGISASGFNSGEDDIENYNAMVEGDVRAKADPAILMVLKLRCQQQFGMIPDDLEFTWQSLRMMTSEQEENVKTQKFSRVFQARQAGEITREEFRDACNKAQLLEIQLETDPAIMDELEDEALAEGEADSEVSVEKPPAGKKPPLPKDAK